MPARLSRCLCALSLLAAFSVLVVTRPTASGAETEGPDVKPASDEAQRRISAFQVPEELTVSLIAAEPHIANPVAFSIDDQGRYWVCETYRIGHGVVDNRSHMGWLLDDLAAQTVQDRLTYFKEHLSDKEFASYSERQDRVRLLTDENDDGRVDRSIIFAGDFDGPLAGIGSDVLKVGEDVFYTCIPHLWRLRDTDGDGRADVRKPMFSGFGVRTAFIGHDLHGLTVGPDGRLYFSIGDRGINVVNKEGQRLKLPYTGSVLRCELDGSHLEIFAYGMRNPQDLAFDNFGNLFTGDNNSDSGDQARLVHVVAGSDSGWRMYYQYLDDRGPWNRSMYWYPYDSPPRKNGGPGGVPAGSVAKKRQPAYILPPIINLTSGPSGLAYYPGVGLSPEYENHFFLCDFRGSPGSSGLHVFSVEPDGAGFELAETKHFVWRILCTDVGFTPSGTLVLSDWVNGWGGTGKGRLYGFTNSKYTSAESAKLLADDFSTWDLKTLVALFDHPDQRVRQKAHLEVAARDADAFPLAAIKAILQNDDPIAAFHATWALGVSLRKHPQQPAGRLEALSVATRYPDPRVATQALRALAECLASFAPDPEMPLLEKIPATMEMLGEAINRGLQKEVDPRLKRGALLAIARLGKIGIPTAQPPRIARMLAILAAQGDADPVMRHAVQYALATSVDGERLVQLGKDAESPIVRAGIVVALRRQRTPDLALFLHDPDPQVVAEAARAINDLPLDQATQALAGLAGEKNLLRPTLRRVLNANFRLGKRENAEAVARIAANPKTPRKLRIEAITELKLWNNPPKTDRVIGKYRPVPPRQLDALAEIIRPQLDELLAAKSGRTRIAGIELAQRYQISSGAGSIRAIFADTDRSDDERVAALNALASFTPEDLPRLLGDAIDDPSSAVRARARSLWSQLAPEAAVPVLAKAIRQGELVEKQAAVTALAKLETPAADAVLADLLTKLEKGTLPAGIELEVLDAAKSRPALESRAAAYIANRQGDPMKAYAAALYGGDAERGRDIFFNRESVACQRCHKADDGKGGDVGPDLSQIGTKKKRQYLLESIITPNAVITENFESVVVVTEDGLVKTGVKRAEDKQTITLITAEAKIIKIPKQTIIDRSKGKSAMPEDLLKHLSKRDIRDLVEFLAGQK